MMPHANQALIVALLGISVAACTSNEVRVEKAQNDALTCNTFAWRRAGAGTESITEQRVRAEVFKQLEKKGYSLAPEKPDCQVTFAYGAHERAAPRPSVGVGVGTGSGHIGGGIGVSIPLPGTRRTERAGDFSISVIDTAKNAEIWHGAVEATSKTEELSSQDVARLVDRVLAEFPESG